MEAHMPQSSSIRSAVLVELRLVTDGQTQTQGHGLYGGCIALRGNKKQEAQLSPRDRAMRHVN